MFIECLQQIVISTTQSIQLINKQYNNYTVSDNLQGLSRLLKEAQQQLDTVVKQHVTEFTELFREPLEQFRRINYRIEEGEDTTNNIYAVETMLQSFKNIVSEKTV